LLEHALTQAEPEGYVRVFVDEGEPIQLLISNYELQSEKRKHGEGHNAIEYASKLLAAFAQPAALPPAGIRNPTPPRSGDGRHKSAMIEALSERELEVLKLLVTELSGPEIADRLTVSLNTARTHTKNIYGKLGANSRRAAVRRAEDLGLL
jgi:LuxR family maltose regulon positive regulatory protein